MSRKYFFVVGDKFKEFAEGKDVLTFSQFKSLANLPAGLMSSHAVLILGQGMPEDEVQCLLKKCQAAEMSVFETSDLNRVSNRAHPGLSHKVVPHNTVIGVPEQMSEAFFQIPLNVDERCELMGDHQTGQHLQGMVLVEAFRQSFLAVTECFFPFGEEKSYFVINGMNTEFHSFLFPLPAHIDYRILSADCNERRARYKVTMSARQNGVECACAQVDFTVYAAGNIARKEAQLADDVTLSMLGAWHLSAAIAPGGDAPAQAERQMVQA